MAADTVVALEIGTSRVRALVAEECDDGHLMVTAAGQCESRGVRKGEIVDFDNALACVRKALEMAEDQGRVLIDNVHLLVAGGHIRSVVNRGVVPVLREDREITEEAIEQVMEMARAINLPPERTLLHSICQRFFVDDQAGVVNPLGMEGSRLALDMLLLHGVRTRLRNSIRVVKSAHVEVEDIAFGGLCSGLAVLTAPQKENGVILIDLGGGTTDFLVYAEKTIAAAGSLTVGGDHVTNDLAVGLRIPQSQAEPLKCKEGRVNVPEAQQDQRVAMAAESGFPGKGVRLGDVSRIIEARMDETLTLVRDAIAEQCRLSTVTTGVVLTGGAARLKGLTGLCERIFELPCQLGQPRDVSGLAVVSEGTEYAAPIGLARYAFRSERAGRPRESILSWVRNLWARG